MATLNENILKVKDTFDDIASAIVEKGVEVSECDSPETYAQKIRSIETGGGLDPEKLYVEAFEENGPEPTVTSTPTDDGGVILTFGLRRGEPGRNGDSIQYIFTATSNLEKPQDPTPSDWETNEAYQDVNGEYVPAVADQVWSIDPVVVTETVPYCWFSTRRFKNGAWTVYSTPAIWEEYRFDEPDVIVIDMDPDSVMVTEDNTNVETTIKAYRGSDVIVIQDITYKCRNSSDTIECVPIQNEDSSWTLKFSNLNSTSPLVYIDIDIKISDKYTRTRTFSIYQTKYDSETVSVDFIPDELLVPCPDGVRPDENYFPIDIPVSMRVGGQAVIIEELTAIDPAFTEYSFVNDVLTIKTVPEPSRGSIGFTVNGGGKSVTNYLHYTKINTKGGLISVYSLNVNANDIVCDTTKGKNEYTVYNGKQGLSDNTIKVAINEFSTEGNKQYKLSELSNYAVFYANDPQDWFEDESSTNHEYVRMDDNGILIGEGGVFPDNCVAFQLREWIGSGEPWSTTVESDYKVWQTETIVVDIIRNIKKFVFVIEPNKVHRNVEGQLITPSNGQIEVSLCEAVSGDNTSMTPLTELPAGYDLYYKIDDGSYIKAGGETETVKFPYAIDVNSANSGIMLRLIVDEASDDDNIAVLSELVEVTSDVPGPAAYVGYLTDNLGIVSCNADGEPTDGQVLSTTFKVTNGTIDSITHNYNGGSFLINCSGDTITFSEFESSLSETTSIKLTATYTDKDGVQGREEAVYTIIKLKIAEASTILDFSNDNIIVPCDNDYQPYIDSANVYVIMTHGEESLKLTTDESEIYQLDPNADEEGYHKLTLDISKLEFVDNVCNLQLRFVGTDSEGVTYTKKGQLIITRVPAGESGKVWDLVLNNDSPKFNNSTDLFDDDYIEGWVNVWSKEVSSKATYQELVTGNYYIVYKPTEDFDNTEIPFQVLSEGDFNEGVFRIYINPQEDGKTYVDLDTPSGVTIGFARKVGDTYEIVQKEQMKASFDGRDFSKFELLISDSTINKVYTDDSNYSISPNEIKILGVYEYDGAKRTVVNDSTKLHNKHVSGLDIYYSVDYTPSSDLAFDEEHFIRVEDTGNDGWASNDTINISNLNIQERLDVYLVAHYDDSSVEGNDTKLQVIDHKPLIVNPIKIPALYHLELSQDEVKVPIDNNGDVDPDFEVIVTPRVYSQDDIQNITCYYAFGGNDTPATFETEWDNTEFTAADFSGENSYIWFYVNVQGGLYKKCKITKEVNAIEMFVDKDVVKREFSDNLVHDSISVEAKQWNYIANTWDNVSNYKVTMLYKVVGNSSIKTGETISFSDRTTATFDLNKQTYYGIDYVKFVLYSSDDVECGFEEVGVITDGADGSSREVIYYQSTVESAPDNPTPTDWETNVEYQKDDYEPTGWSDDYPGVDSVNKFVYACERKRTRGANSQWGQYSTPHLYAVYTESTLTDEEKTNITDAVIEATQTNLDNAKEQLATDISNAETRLNTAIENEKAARESGDEEALKNARSEIAAATLNLATKTEVNTAVTGLENKYFNNGKLNEDAGPFSETDIYALSIAALGKNASEVGGFNPDTDLAADNIFAQCTNSVLGRFVKITADDIEAGTITADKFATGAIPEGLDEDDVTTIIGQTEIDGGKIRTDSITSTQIAANAITANEIATGAITAGKIAAGAITADKIDANAITADKIDVEDLSINGQVVTYTLVGENNVRYIAVGDADSMTGVEANTLYIVI